MHRLWQKAFGTILLGLMFAVPVAGCGARPAPRPEAGGGNPTEPIDPDLGAAVARTASGVGGTGTVEAVVMGEKALVALELNTLVPGGTGGGTASGPINNPDLPGTSPAGGPRHMKGVAGNVGITTAMPGGGKSPGGATPGGSPNYTQAAPNGRGGLATQSPGGATPLPTPGTYGAAPMDVMTRVADQVKAHHPMITEVHFATIAEDALRLAQIARAVRTGGSGAAYEADVKELFTRSLPAGTEEISPLGPPQGEGYHQQQRGQQ